MPRAPSVWFRKQTGWYCTKIRGTVHKLATTEREAQKAFYKLMASDAPAARAKAGRHSVRWLCDRFLDRTKDSKGSETFKVQKSHLLTFCEQFGKKAAESIRVHEVNDWLDSGESWSESTKGLIVMIVKAVFNWAVAEDHLTETPLKKLKRRKVARRERMLSTDEKKRVFATVGGPFRDFLSILIQTGMRPFSEAAKLTAAMVDWEEKCAVLKNHKNAKKGKKRAVFFPPAAVEILQRLSLEHPTGLLFRNTRGNEWGRDTVHNRLKRLCEDTGIEHFNVYSLRATYVTEALIRGVPVEMVAELVGTSPKMIHLHYALIDKKTDALRAAAEKAVAE